MARITVTEGSSFAEHLEALAGQTDEIAKKGLYEGAKIVADRIKVNLDALPVEKSRWLKEGEKYEGITEAEKSGLASCFGITSMKQSAGAIHLRIGFAGYVNSHYSKKYPHGLPAQVIARSIESGSSVRAKKPFMRNAVAATKETAKAKMCETIENEIKSITGGK